MPDPGEIHVWHGTIIKTEDRRSLTIELSQWHGEAWEAFIKRVDAICDHAVSLTPKSEPVTIDFSDTTRFRKINDHAYEVLTPGYKPKEEPGSERDTHFAVWAASVWHELHALFTRQIPEEDYKRYEALDKAIIARAGYDLMLHVLTHSLDSFDPVKDREVIESIPDMPAPPEHEEGHTEEE